MIAEMAWQQYPQKRKVSVSRPRAMGPTSPMIWLLAARLIEYADFKNESLWSCCCALRPPYSMVASGK
jgi:hypothetical protein